MSSLVPGYTTVSWTVSPPAVGVRVTCGVEGRPAGQVVRRMKRDICMHVIECESTMLHCTMSTWSSTTVIRTHRGLGVELTVGCWSQQS